MSLLTGLTADGIEVPVQVKPDGKLVAEGLTGPVGGVGPQGGTGPAGPKGDDKWTGNPDISYLGGRVGIGTSGPTRTLEVSNTLADNFARVNTTGASKSGIEFSNGGAVYSQLYFNNIFPYDVSLLQQVGTGSLIFGTNNTERARFDSSGRLGVGTTTPRTLLHVSGAISANDGIEIQSPDGSWWSIAVSDAGAVNASRRTRLSSAAQDLPPPG